MTEVSTLGIKVEAQGVVSADAALDGLTEAAGRAEAAVDSLSSATEKADASTKKLTKDTNAASDGARRLGKDAEGAGRGTRTLGDGAQRASEGATKLGQEADKATRGVKGLGDGAQRAGGGVRKAGEDAQRASAQFSQMEGGTGRLMAIMGRLGAVAAATFSIGAIVRYADAWSDMQSRVGAATKSMEGAPALMQRLTDIANASYSPIEQTVEVYSRNVTVLREMGRSSEEAADFTESLNNMLVLTATRGERAASVQDALSKAMATGKLEADGLETVLANGGEVAAALARELNTTTGGLRAVASQGKITGTVISSAVIKSLDDVRERAAEMPATIGDSFVILGNAVTEFVGRVDKASGASSAVADVIIRFSAGVRQATTYVIAFGAAAAPVFSALGSAMGFVAEYSGLALAGVAAFYTPAVIGGIGTLVSLVGTKLVGAVRLLTAAMMANPIGLLVAGVAAATYAIYKFSDDISKFLGFDIANAAKTGANIVIGSFAAAYEDIKFVWNNFGDMMGGAVIGGVNYAIRSINTLIQGAVDGLRALAKVANYIPGVNIEMSADAFKIDEIANPYAKRLADVVGERNRAVMEALSRDYIGDLSSWFSGIGSSAPEGAGGAAGSGKGVKGAGTGTAASLKVETDAFKDALKAQTDALEDAMARNESLFKLGVRQASEYYAQKGSLERQAAQATAVAAGAELAAVQALIDSGRGDAKERAKLLEDRKRLVREVTAANVSAYRAEQKAIEDLHNHYMEAQRDLVNEYRSGAQSARDQANALAEQNAQYGMSRSTIAQLTATRSREEGALARERLAMAQTNGAREEELELIRQQIKAIDDRSSALQDIATETGRQEIREAQKEIDDTNKEMAKDLGNSLTDALMRGFENGSGFAENFVNTTKNMFSSMVLKPIIQPIAQGAADGVLGMFGMGSRAGGEDGSGSTFGNILSSAKTAYSAVTGGLTSSIASGVGAIGTAIGSSAFTSFAAGMKGASLAAGLAGPTTVGAAGALGMGAAFAKAIPYVGWAYAAVQLISALTSGGEKRSGGTFGLVNGQSQFIHGPSGGTEGQDQIVNGAIDAISNSINARFAALGSSTTVTSLIGGFETSKLNRGGVMAGVGLSDGRYIGQDGTGSNYKGTYYNPQFGFNMDLETATAAFQVALNQLPLMVLQTSQDIPQAMRDLLDGVDIASLSAEALQSLQANVDAQIGAVAALRSLPYKEIATLSYDAAAGLAAVAGDLEALANNRATYQQNFYTEAENAELSFGEMRGAVEKLGLAMPTTIAAFRQLVEAQDLTSEAGQQAYVTLMAINGQFKNWVDYGERIAALPDPDAQPVIDMAALQTSYLAAVLDDSEKLAREGDRLRGVFSDLGVAIPTNVLEFRQLVDSIDDTTEYGMSLKVALMQSAPAFVAYTSAINNVTSAVSSTLSIIKGIGTGVADAEREAQTAFSGVQRAIETERDRLQTAFDLEADGLRESITTAEGAVQRIRALAQNVQSTIDGLVAQYDPAQTRQSAQDLIRQVVRTGVIGDQEGITKALSTLSKAADTIGFAAAEAYDRDALRTLNDLSALQGVVGAQTSIEQRSLDVLNLQLKAAEDNHKSAIRKLDDQLKKADDQLRAQLGTLEIVRTIPEALAIFGKAIAALGTAQGNSAPASQVDQWYDKVLGRTPDAAGSQYWQGQIDKNGLDATQQEFARASQDELWLQQVYQRAMGRAPDLAGLQWWLDALKRGHSRMQVEAAIYSSAEASRYHGSHASGLDSVPFDNYRANLHRGERIQTAEQARIDDMRHRYASSGQATFAQNEMIRVIQQMMGQIQGMRAETLSTAQSTAKMARLFDRLTPTGDAIQVREAQP